jgi:ribonuclease HIII
VIVTEQQATIISQLEYYIRQQGFELLEVREIQYAQQFILSNGLQKCSVNVYTSGKMTVGGQATPLKQQVQEWVNMQQAAVQGNVIQHDSVDNTARTTRYIVAPSKVDKIRGILSQITAEITWYDQDRPSGQVYRAEIRSGSEKVVATQYQTGTLLVQGRASDLFDQVCNRLDQNLVQDPADRATRYIPDSQREAALTEMNRSDAEEKAWMWLIEHLGQSLLDFLPKYDQDTLISGTMLLQAVQGIHLQMPDYSPLVMPFARAYEGFLVKLFIKIGLADADEIEKDVRSIRVGAWLDQLPELIEDSYRHGHLASDLKTAWEGTRHLTIHSDPTRQVRMETLEKAENEICGVLVRAFERGYKHLVQEPIRLKAKTEREHQIASDLAVPIPQKAESKKNRVRIEGIDEPSLLSRLKQAGCTVEYYPDPSKSTKWRVVGEGWKVFCPREPGNTIVVRGSERDSFVRWYHGEQFVKNEQPGVDKPAFVAHIGVDEAGKGDYFGPLVSAAVYVTRESALELIRRGVRDSKALSDTTIVELALEIRECCPHVVRVLGPAEYNEAYQKYQNLNTLLAELHARVIQKLVEKTMCKRVLVDQFAAPEVLIQAIGQAAGVELSQRPKAESDVAVAAASILARESFVAAIEDYRVKTEMEIPLGASSPQVVQIGKAIVRKWGKKGLERIAKINFKTTQQVLE